MGFRGMMESIPFVMDLLVTMSTTMMAPAMMARMMRFISLPRLAFAFVDVSATSLAREGGFPAPSRYLLKMESTSLRAVCLFACAIVAAVPSLRADPPRVTLAAPGYAVLPSSLAAMSYPHRRVPRKVMVDRVGGTMLACDVFPLPARLADSPWAMLGYLRERVSSAQPEVSWGWGGSYRLGDGEWVAWEFSTPSMGGPVSTVLAVTKTGSSIFAISVSSASSEQTLSAAEFGKILSSVKFAPPDG